MGELIIKNFKFGLDTRRSELTSQPGTLKSLTNAHINQGGEVEQRKAFVPTSLPANTFGAESTDSGIITFGSIADPGGWPIGNVTAYQRLQHPAVLDGAVFDAAKHAMTMVRFSLPFLGKAFVVATYADGYTFSYYNGTLVEQSRRGEVLSALTATTALATQLAATFTGVSGFHTSVNSSTIDIWSDFGVTYALSAAQLVSTSGVLSFVKISDSTDETPGVSATGDFQIVATATTGSVTSVKANSVEILGGTISGAGLTTTTQVATAIAAQINTYQSSPKYTASSSGDKVFIYAPASLGATANTYVVSVTASGICIGAGSFALPVSVDGTTCTSILAGVTEILGAVITRSGSETNWAIAIAAQIVTFNTAYTATNVAGVVYVSKKTTLSSDTNVTLTITLSAGSVVGDPPTAPQNIKMTAGALSNELGWDLVAGAVNYSIKRSLAQGGPYSALATVADPTPNYIDTTVGLNVHYYYVITAINSAGESLPSAEVSHLDSGLSYTSLVFIAMTGKIRITGLGAPINVFKSTGADGPFTILATTQDNPFDDSDVIAGVHYYYKFIDASHDNGITGGVPQASGLTPPCAVTVDHLLITGTSASKDNNVVVHSGSVKATGGGGVKPYTYDWQAVNNPSGIALNRVAHNQTSFFANVPKGEAFFGTFACFVTDAAGNQSVSPVITVKLSHTNS